MHYFRVLPTNPDFQALTPAQKFQIFCSFKEIPFTLEDVQKSARQERESEVVPALTKEDLEDSGMSEESMDWYLEQINSARKAIEGNDGGGS